MNMFTDHFLDDVFEWERSPKEGQWRLWTIPCGAMNHDNPGDTFMRELNANPPFGAEIIPSDDVIPFPENES